jgi:miniconductance mechanosensitive channel
MFIPVIINFYHYAIPYENVAAHVFINKLIGASASFLFIFLFNSFINTIDDLYRGKEVSKTKPLHGLFQVIKIGVFIFCVISMVSILAGQNPVVLIGGFGAMFAVITLIFKDAILGFIAGLQIVNDELIRIGDWVEIPKHNANGHVVELSMTTVKVTNLDNSFTSIPAYALLSDSFINWRGMRESGGRRIKRAIHIDLRDICFCDGKMLESFGEINILRDFIENQKKLAGPYTEEDDEKPGHVLNKKYLTNIGVFRAYIQAYIEGHPRLKKDMTLVVRQLAADRFGIPLEIVAFANAVELAGYEEIQSEIFDHLYAAAGTFGLRLYQFQINTDITSPSEN